MKSQVGDFYHSIECKHRARNQLLTLLKILIKAEKRPTVWCSFHTHSRYVLFAEWTGRVKPPTKQAGLHTDSTTYPLLGAVTSTLLGRPTSESYVNVDAMVLLTQHLNLGRFIHQGNHLEANLKAKTQGDGKAGHL